MESKQHEISLWTVSRELAEALDLDSLHSIRSRENFVNEYLPAISARAKPFFPLGSSYFQTGNQGNLALVSCAPRRYLVT